MPYIHIQMHQSREDTAPSLLPELLTWAPLSPDPPPLLLSMTLLSIVSGHVMLHHTHVVETLLSCKEG